MEILAKIIKTILKIALVIAILYTIVLGVSVHILAHIVEETIPVGYDYATYEQTDDIDVFEVNAKCYYWKNLNTGEMKLIKTKTEKNKVL